jgi:hypothetical protein
MFFGALIALDHVGEYVQRLGRNLDAAAFDTARGFSEYKTRAALIQMLIANSELRELKIPSL